MFPVLLLLFYSCKKTITINLPEEANKPVLNLLMSKDSLIIARVTVSSRTSGNDIFPEVKEATLKLYENGTFKENLAPFLLADLTYYKGTSKAVAGATYRVVASVPGYEDVEGSDFIPEQASVGEMSVKLVKDNDGWGSKGNISVVLHDKAGEKNYYRIRLYELVTLKDAVDTVGTTYKFKVDFQTNELQDGIFNKESEWDFYTDDALFDGRSPRFNFITGRGGEFKKVIVEVTSLTYSSYSYLHSSFMARLKNEDPLSERVIVFNNILNGLGIVGGMAIKEYLIMP